MSTGPNSGKSDGEFREGAGPLPRSAAALSAEDLITLNEEIAGMAKAGLPLDQGLSTLAREMGSGRLQKVTATLAADLRAGLTLPQALERQGGRVPPYYASLLAAAIRSGRIGDMLGTLTLYARSLNDFRSISSAHCSIRSSCSSWAVCFWSSSALSSCPPMSKMLLESSR